MPAHRKCSPETDDAFFDALARGVPVSVACRATDCSRQALYRRRVKDLAFDGRWRDAETIAADARLKARPRKRVGFATAVFAPRRGKSLSDGMLLGRLKALRPEYRAPRVPGSQDPSGCTVIEERDAYNAVMKKLRVRGASCP